MVSIMEKIRCYKELRTYSSAFDRYLYLRIGGVVGDSTFGFDRYLNQAFYRSKEWLDARREVIIRDNGCDMGLEGYPISGEIVVHHMNPITMDDIESRNSDIFNPEYLICLSSRTHKAVHFGDSDLLPRDPVIRVKGDTCLWG